MSNKVSQSSKKTHQVATRIIKRYERQIMQLKDTARNVLAETVKANQQAYDDLENQWKDRYNGLIRRVKIGAAATGAVILVLVALLVWG